jgi:magnesium chelatase subunit D
MALAHRARRDPLEPAGIDGDRLDDAMSEHLGDDDSRADDHGGEDGGGDDDGGSKPQREQQPRDTGDPRKGLIPLPQRSDRRSSASATGGGAKTRAARGRVIGDRIPPGPIRSVAVGATVRAAATRRTSDAAAERPLVAEEDVREAVREHKQSHLVVVAVDASGSMGAAERVRAARSAVLGLLVDAYQRRDLVSLVTFRGDDAEVLLRPTSSVEVARARLQSLPTGGRTPLHAGLTRALEIAKTRASTHRPLVVVITDGRATSAPLGDDPLEAAVAAADSIRRAGVDSVIVDVEGAGGAPHLGLARHLAERMGARHVPVGNLTEETVRIAVEESTSAAE